MEHVGTWEFELDHVALAPDMVLAGTGLPVLLPVIPFALEMLALRRLTTTAFGTLMSLEPAVALILGLLAPHQHPASGRSSASSSSLPASAPSAAAPGAQPSARSATAPTPRSPTPDRAEDLAHAATAPAPSWRPAHASSTRNRHCSFSREVRMS